MNYSIMHHERLETLKEIPKRYDDSPMDQQRFVVEQTRKFGVMYEELWLEWLRETREGLKKLKSS